MIPVSMIPFFCLKMSKKHFLIVYFDSSNGYTFSFLSNADHEGEQFFSPFRLGEKSLIFLPQFIDGIFFSQYLLDGFIEPPGYDLQS